MLERCEFDGAVAAKHPAVDQTLGLSLSQELSRLALGQTRCLGAGDNFAAVARLVGDERAHELFDRPLRGDV